jgi:hypothetical protein
MSVDVDLVPVALNCQRHGFVSGLDKEKFWMSRKKGDCHGRGSTLVWSCNPRDETT